MVALTSMITAAETPQPQQSLGRLKTFQRLKTGIAPSTDPEATAVALSAFKIAYGRSRDANFAIAKRGGSGCRRFIKMYDEVGAQSVQYFEELVANRGYINNKIPQMLAARLRILQFYERTLFGLVLLGSEGGQSDLDKGIRHPCRMADRSAWTGLLLRTHQTMGTLSEKVLGEPSAMEVSAEVESLRKLNGDYGWAQMGGQVAWMIGEITASIVIWEKAASPLLRGVVTLAALTPAGRVVFLSGGTLYVVGWVAFDRYMRGKLTFLSPPPRLLDTATTSSWDRILSLGEEFLISDLFSPPLYFAYAELLDMTRKQAALEFLTDNQEFLEQAEREHGSIEKALQNLKEVIRHENQNHSFDSLNGQRGVVNLGSIN